LLVIRLSLTAVKACGGFDFAGNVDYASYLVTTAVVNGGEMNASFLLPLTPAALTATAVITFAAIPFCSDVPVPFLGPST
jgi:hypothetical protein